MEQKISASLENGIYTVLLNRPEKLNCLETGMLSLLQEALHQAEQDPETHVVLIKGAGDRSFSTGGDLSVFRKLSGPGLAEWIRLGNNVFNRLEKLTKPTLAVIQGFAYGGGLELALACDLRIASENASFSMPELRLGWPPGWGGMTRLRRLLGESKAKEIVYLSEVIQAEEALRIGLVNKRYPEAELHAEAAKIASSLVALDPAVLSIAKTALGDPRGHANAGTDMMYDILTTRYYKEKLHTPPGAGNTG